jgi:hypothetical protein
MLRLIAVSGWVFYLNISIFTHRKQLVDAVVHEAVVMRYEQLRSVKLGMSLGKEGRNREKRKYTFHL